MTSALTLNNQLRFQGNAFYAMIALVSGGVLNIALDALFVSGLNMGTGGAGLATAIGQLLSFALLFLGVERKESLKSDRGISGLKNCTCPISCAEVCLRSAGKASQA